MGPSLPSTGMHVPFPDVFAETGMMPLSEEEFQRIRRLVYDRFGIHLTEQKRSLVVGRLQNYLREHGFASFLEYINFLEQDQSGQELINLVNRISTNHTYFYRESAHFDFFVKTALPEATARHIAENDRDLRIWCAGCASGEEPYTLVILMLEYFGAQYPLWNAGILATDISKKALSAAREGVYPTDRVSLVPEPIKQRYFDAIGPDLWRIKDRVKREVTFRCFNLMNKHFPFKKKFDMIFCRNVMIYFDQPTRMALVQRFFDHTVEGGYLFIGHSETLGREQCPYEYVMPAVYQKKKRT